jgi:hypothetical protein
MYFRIILKVVITAVVVTGISEIAKRSNLFGALLASLPLTSLLAFIWLYIDNHEKEPVAKLSMDIFWMVIPSLAFFPVFSYLLRQTFHFLSPSVWPSSQRQASTIFFSYFLKAAE